MISHDKLVGIEYTLVRIGCTLPRKKERKKFLFLLLASWMRCLCLISNRISLRIQLLLLRNGIAAVQQKSNNDQSSSFHVFLLLNLTRTRKENIFLLLMLNKILSTETNKRKLRLYLNSTLHEHLRSTRLSFSTKLRDNREDDDV